MESESRNELSELSLSTTVLISELGAGWFGGMELSETIKSIDSLNLF